ncbi:MAG TPA: trypsin-like peptidase domain-containing protein, partial [Vampirovibrionales bacterium]
MILIKGYEGVIFMVGSIGAGRTNFNSLQPTTGKDVDIKVLSDNGNNSQSSQSGQFVKINDDIFVLTTAHGANDDKQARVELSNGNTLSGNTELNEEQDIALIQVDDAEVKKAVDPSQIKELSDDEVKPGDKLVAEGAFGGENRAQDKESTVASVSQDEITVDEKDSLVEGDSGSSVFATGDERNIVGIVQGIETSTGPNGSDRKGQIIALTPGSDGRKTVEELAQRLNV